MARRRAAADPAQARPRTADRRLSPHPGAAGGCRPVVRHAPDRARVGAPHAAANALPCRLQRRRRGAGVVGRAPVHAADGALVSGINADHMPAGLHEDRAKLHGLPVPSIEAVRAAGARNLLSCARRSVAGRDAGRRSALSPRHTALHRRLRGLSRDVVPHAAARSTAGTRSLPYPRLLAWRDRIAAIGHGKRSDIDPAAALAEARAAEPAAPARTSHPQEGDPRPGERARVRPADNARDWVEGEVSFIDTQEIALVRQDPDVGRVAVHFPRLGYDWRRA